MDSRPWTSEETALLKDKYDKWFLKTIAEELNRTEHAVRMKAYKLGLIRQGNRKQFLENEIDYIVENYPTMSVVKIAENVGCSEARIYSFARQLDLKKASSEILWTDGEIEFLKNNLAMSYDDLSKKLNKSDGRIKKKMKELGLKKMPPSKWTAEEDQILIDNIEKVTLGQLNSLLGKSNAVIRTRCKQLELDQPALLKAGWNEEQDQLLRADYGLATISETAQKLGRAYDSVRARRYRIGLTTNYDDMPKNDAIIRELSDKGMYVNQIAKETGFTIKLIIRYCHENRIAIKTEPKTLNSEIRACQYGFEEPVNLKEKGIRLFEWYRHWVKTFRLDGISEGTKNKYYATYCHLYESKIGNMQLKNIRRSDFQAYANEYGKERSKATVYYHLQILRSCMSDAMADGLIGFNPAANIQVVYKEQRLTPMEHKQKREEKKWLEIDEYQRFKQHLIMTLQLSLYKEPDFGSSNDEARKSKISNQTMMMIILVALKTGMRFSEILGLTRSDVLKTSSELVVDKTWGYRKGREHNKFLPTKNIASIRNVAVDPEMMIMLDLYTRWQDQYDQQTLENTLFISPKADIFNSTVNRRLAELLEGVGIKPLTLHKLRHTQASYLIAKKVPIEVVAKRLGHTDTNMIRKTYGHLLKETEEQGISQILSLI